MKDEFETKRFCTVGYHPRISLEDVRKAMKVSYVLQAPCRIPNLRSPAYHY